MGKGGDRYLLRMVLSFPPPKPLQSVHRKGELLV